MTLNRRTLLIASAAGLAGLSVPALAQAGFDHSHADWTALLKKHVVLERGGRASSVRYAAFVADRAALKAYLASLSAVPRASFDGWSKLQRMAFLVNAYNAFTVELILTRYPKLESIKDLGALFSTPWKPQWIALLGGMVSLDDIEHGMLRAKTGAQRYDEPRVHFAVNCASIGCPALREEAFVAERMEAQLEEQTRRFLSDRTRNRYNTERGRLEVSKIFDWFGEDFRAGHLGIRSLNDFLARYAEQLADAPAERERIRSQKPDISFLDYDWKLNDAKG
jgi:hypothetical protein